MAAVDRVVHHSVILDMVGVPSYRILQAEKDRLPVASETHQPNQASAHAPQ
jgi:hypothetical protein